MVFEGCYLINAPSLDQQNAELHPLHSALGLTSVFLKSGISQL
jgi:hypothetical protein